ncbi:MAG: hypothetical protein WAZ14_02435 [Patescibacteria group bacterium]
MFWRKWARGLILVGFFLSILALSWPLNHGLFVSPDENATYIFAQAWAETGQLAIAEPLNLQLGGILHPRSAIGYGDTVIPASFVGFILLLGTVGYVFGQSAMLLVTPLLAVLTIWLWRESVRQFFKDEKLADWSALLLLIHPAFWYYSSRVMMHNVAFLFCLVVGLWWLLSRPLVKRSKGKFEAWALASDYLVAGAWFGAACVIRTSELLWVGAALVVGLWLARRSVTVKGIAGVLVGFALMLGVLGLVNYALYGSPVLNGYTVHYAYPEPALEAAPVSEVATDVAGRNLLLPFGFNERVIWYNVVNYGFKLYPWMSILALTGMVLVAMETGESRRRWLMVLMFTLALAMWLGVVYGSWRIIDNPDPKIISLGNSHVRYWLPLFALASVFAGKAVTYMWGEHGRLRRLFVAGLGLLVLSLSFRLVFFGHDGIVPSLQALATFEAKRSAILELVEGDGIVIVDRADKYLFPDRRVVGPLRSEATYAAIPDMLELAPVYYFGITLPPEDIEYLNQQKLFNLGVKIELVVVLQEESLYRLSKN